MKGPFNLIIILCLTLAGYSQTKHDPYPRIGNQIKDFVFTDTWNNGGSPFKISSHKGKWLIIDFWTEHCMSCIKAFPKMNKLNQQFKGKVDILLVGMYGPGRDEKGKTEESRIKTLYSYHQKAKKLTLPVAFDKTAGDYFDVYSAPCILVINPEGRVMAKTIAIDSASLFKLIEGKKPLLVYNYSRHESYPSLNYRKDLPLLTNGKESNGGIDTSFISRSMLTKWNPKMPYFANGWEDTSNNTGEANAIGFDLPSLIRIAYTGMSLWGYWDSAYRNKNVKLILENSQKDLFLDNNGNKDTLNTYAYTIKFPRSTASPRLFRKTLLEDLQRSFGFNSSIEIRKSTVYRLVVIDEQKVLNHKSVGGRQRKIMREDVSGFKLTNYSMDDLLNNSSLTVCFEYLYENNYIPPIIDATGIEYNIDLDFDGDTLDYDNVIRNLRACGLDLVKGEMDMKCIVIRDNN